QTGDVFVSIDGRRMKSFATVQRYVSPRADREIEATLSRNGTEYTVTIMPERLETEDRFGNKMEQGIIGITSDPDNAQFQEIEYGPVSAIVEAHKETGYIIARTGSYLYGVITGRERADQIGGPIRVAQVSGQVATLGFVALLNLAAILSISIGLLNLLPIPVLDGGHLLFYAIEAVRGRPLSRSSMEYGYRFGFALLIALMVFATWNDLIQLFGRT
ncbi:MAG: RIP metalloprotease RseP, partial [Pseudomonadota bacterium]